MANQITITGHIYRIGEIQTIGSKGFQKREVVVDTGDQFDNFISVEFTRDEIDLVTSYRIGEKVSISGFLGGREWQGRVFNSFKGKRITPLTPPVSQNNSQPVAQSVVQVAQQSVVSSIMEGHDDLPF